LRMVRWSITSWRGRVWSGRASILVMRRLR
jgi:hypothetical protein